MVMSRDWKQSMRLKVKCLLMKERSKDEREVK